MNNIQILNGYGVKKIVNSLPALFQYIKNEYPELGGNYEVIHHATFIQQLKRRKNQIERRRWIQREKSPWFGLPRPGQQWFTKHPRTVLQGVGCWPGEMKRCRTTGLCCGAGGAQMFKRTEKGNKDINIARAEEAIETHAKTVAVACPFWATMLTDGIKNKEKEAEIKVKDLQPS